MEDFISALSLKFSDPSIYIAIFALALTIITLWQQRNHDRLSVKPLANFHLVNFPDGIKIVIKNDGLGPMIIKSIRTFKEGDPERNDLGWPPEPLHKLKYSKISLGPIFGGALENVSLSNGKSLVIFEHNCDISDKTHVDLVKRTKDSLKDLTIELVYSSIYEKERFNLTTDLKNFSVDIFPGKNWKSLDCRDDEDALQDDFDHHAN